MERTLMTERGRALYKKRGQRVEPVLGQIKAGRGILHFMRRGLAACAQEWTLICTTPEHVNDFGTLFILI